MTGEPICKCGCEEPRLRAGGCRKRHRDRMRERRKRPVGQVAKLLHPAIFWAKVTRASSEPNSCWVWTGITDWRGRPQYEFMTNRVRNRVKPHRYTYELLKGPIPGGYQAHHKCLNILCVNPWHLGVLTPAEHTAAHVDLRRYGAAPRRRSRLGAGQP